MIKVRRREGILARDRFNPLPAVTNREDDSTVAWNLAA
jgi:hypothetical protein